MTACHTQSDARIDIEAMTAVPFKEATLFLHRKQIQCQYWEGQQWLLAQNKKKCQKLATSWASYCTLFQGTVTGHSNYELK